MCLFRAWKIFFRIFSEHRKLKLSIHILNICALIFWPEKNRKRKTDLDLKWQRWCCANLYFHIKVAKFINRMVLFWKFFAHVKHRRVYSSKTGAVQLQSKFFESYEHFKQYFNNEMRSMNLLQAYSFSDKKGNIYWIFTCDHSILSLTTGILQFSFIFLRDKSEPVCFDFKCASLLLIPLP